MLKKLRSIVAKKERGHTSEGVADAPDEAIRQSENYHNYSFSPKVSEDGESWFDDTKQDKGKRADFYAKHKLRRMGMPDAENHPHTVANYLNIMHRHFPDISKEMNHSPLTIEDNTREYKAAMPLKDRMRHKFERAYAIVAPKSYNKYMGKQMKKDLEHMRKLSVQLHNDPSMKKIHANYTQSMTDRISKWHADNPDFHHLSAEQAYPTFAHDYQNNDEYTAMVSPPKDLFMKHWDSLKTKK